MTKIEKEQKVQREFITSILIDVMVNKHVLLYVEKSGNKFGPRDFLIWFHWPGGSKGIVEIINKELILSLDMTNIPINKDRIVTTLEDLVVNPNYDINIFEIDKFLNELPDGIDAGVLDKIKSMSTAVCNRLDKERGLDTYYAWEKMTYLLEEED